MRAHPVQTSPCDAVVDRRLPVGNLPTQYRISTDFRESESLGTLNAIASTRPAP